MTGLAIGRNWVVFYSNKEVSMRFFLCLLLLALLIVLLSGCKSGESIFKTKVSYDIQQSVVTREYYGHYSLSVETK